MTLVPEAPHIYQRDVVVDAHDSLHGIASAIAPGQSVLDLGMGTGGLARFLIQRDGDCIADGVTYNAEEARRAGNAYRNTWVADLEDADLVTLTAGARYDRIVCADVLEHLRDPAHVLRQCHDLLAPNGRVLISVPNMAYCGLLAELLCGDFRYRPEGLLDQTHVRFFTRTSLHRLLRETGWAVEAAGQTQRTLDQSEFALHFDRLPPAVARHVLSAPDALTYQFVWTLAPSEVSQTTPEVEVNAPTSWDSTLATPRFSAQLFADIGQGFSEAQKWVVAGSVGVARQSLRFDLPSSAAGYRQLRLDPADRPGFMTLYALELTQPDGTVLWQWCAKQDPLDILLNPNTQCAAPSPWALSDGVQLLFWGDDPQFLLPLPVAGLAALSQTGGRLTVQCGWPMSADYAQASVAMQTLQAQLHRVQTQQSQLQTQLADSQAQLSGTRTALQRAETHNQVQTQAHQEAHQSLLQQCRAAQRDALTQRLAFEELAEHLRRIERSTVFRLTRPLVRLKMGFDALRTPLAQAQAVNTPSVTPKPAPLPAHATHQVDIIVPIYKGLDDTRCCVESVLRAQNQTPWQLILINDASPEPALTQWLRDIAAGEPRIVLLENATNLGFVGTVNRGMALHPERDVVLLNSDTEVANDWLDRLMTAAYRAPRLGTVTPFSNNATICSYPRFCEGNPMPAGFDTAALDALFARELAGQWLEIPTGVGFCMAIRRECLNDVGLFDEAHFGKGYGEENDFCVRARQQGWRSVHALDVFVRHAGGVSFGAAKSEGERRAIETINRLHPGYESTVQRYVATDPARGARLRIDLARIQTRGLPVVLTIVHNREGGTLRHIQEVGQFLRDKACFLRLTPVPGGVDLLLDEVTPGTRLHFAIPADTDALVRFLHTLGVSHLHYHHTLGHHPDILSLPQRLGVTHDVTAHDFYAYCPQISLTDHTDRYCGEHGLAQCHACLQKHSAPEGLSIEAWRRRHAPLLANARWVITPSADAARRLRQHFPTANYQVVPHSELCAHPHLPQPSCRRILPEGARLKIAVLGALSKIKGADVLEEVATLAAQQGLALEFHLLGYAYRTLRTQPKAALTVHGGYDDPDLPRLIAWLAPDLIWFPAVWPETYSYTLSASLANGCPIVAPRLGAFEERLHQRGWTWLCDGLQSANAWLAFFEHLRSQHFATGEPPEPAQALHPPDAPSMPDFYRGHYCQGLAIHSAAPEALDTLTQQALERDASNVTFGGGSALKNTTLRALMRLRRSAPLSPLARLVPMHWQRRVKTWLGR
ncbi:MAG: hypothetical protein Fur007_04220 [Rhodoferax sp.]